MLEPLDSSSAKTWQLGATTITVGERSPLLATRISEHIQSDGRDEYALVISVQDEWTARFGICKNRVLPKQAVMLDLSRGWAIEFDIQGEFDELLAPQNEIAAALVGTRVSVADIFEFAAPLQQLYVRRVPT